MQYFCAIFQGLAFTLQERQILGIQGLLPPYVSDQDTQAKRVYAEMHRKTSNLEK